MLDIPRSDALGAEIQIDPTVKSLAFTVDPVILRRILKNPHPAFDWLITWAKLLY